MWAPDPLVCTETDLMFLPRASVLFTVLPLHFKEASACIHTLFYLVHLYVEEAAQSSYLSMLRTASF